VRELQALVVPKPPQGFAVRGQSGLVINKLCAQCCAKHARGARLVGHNEVQGECKQAGEEAGFTAGVDVKHGHPRELHAGD